MGKLHIDLTDTEEDLPKAEKPAEKPQKPAKKAEAGSVKAGRGSKSEEERQMLAGELARGLPSPSRESLRDKLRHRTQLNFNRVPVFVRDAFNERAEALGMSKIEYFYHLLRKDGVDIPPYEQMDRRTL
ncbi:conserved protein [Tepidicaulis marinus]|uniref:Conserved protein n=1 Tax=Tepidicaulis marinus TaxID=1333998 RepID=A0A081BF12_9HYPH|nr:hypothetical protein [Tepidicaulis marinus]GAK46630.1 conserved protein [Tepidicaulis marinus]